MFDRNDFKHGITQGDTRNGRPLLGLGFVWSYAARNIFFPLWTFIPQTTLKILSISLSNLAGIWSVLSLAIVLILQMSSISFGKYSYLWMASYAIRQTGILLTQSTRMHISLCQCHLPSCIARWYIISNVITVNPFEWS